MSPEVQPQILRLTIPKLKGVWGPVRSDDRSFYVMDFRDGTLAVTGLMHGQSPFKRSLIASQKMVSFCFFHVRWSEIAHRTPRAAQAKTTKGRQLEEQKC